MASILAHPFRVAGGAVAVVDSDSDDGLAQQVAVLLTTRKGERQLLPSYGVSDPVFSSYDLAEVNAGLAMWGPAVQVTGITVAAQDAVTERVQVTFSPRGGGAT